MKSSSGITAITAMFTRAKDQNRAAFLPYFPIGYPNYETSIEAIIGMAEVGVDGFEIGIPFSDPLADGPVIQAATQVALNNGTTVKQCLDAVHLLRARGVTQPMLMMGYLNPLLAYGLAAFVHDAWVAGADGLIVPDLPPEEADSLAEMCAARKMALIFFVAPTSSPERIKMVAQNATGFIYIVAFTGITGARAALATDIKEYIARVREHSQNPLVMGFGISTPEQAQAMNGLVEGFIVGSALVLASKEGATAVRTLAASLRAALSN
jgi:tryptophan synthase alpha chain